MSKKDRDILSDSSDSDFERFFESASKLKVPPSKTGKEAAWNMLMQSIDEKGKEEVKVRSISSYTFWFSVAASILVIFTISTLFYKYSTLDFTSSKGNMANVSLPDGSSVVLNADSQIEFCRFGWLSDREIRLRGEAYFDVKHGNQFTVIVEFNKKVVVTGTRFNVFARGKQFEVKCFEGSVRVETLKSNPITLTKGKGINLSEKLQIPQHFDIDSTSISPRWINGDYYFSNHPLNFVFEELARQFNTSITFNGFEPDEKKYTGYFNHKSLTQALDLVCIPMGLTYQISSDSTSVKIFR